jgi:hypothetical protein
MAAHWGVDSLNPSSTVLGIKGRPTLFDYVCDQAGRVPAFWVQQPCKTNIAAKPIPTHFKPAELEGVQRDWAFDDVERQRWLRTWRWRPRGGKGARTPR